MATETANAPPESKTNPETPGQKENQPQGQAQENSEATERARVRITDPDFLIMLIIAGTVDLMDIFLEPLAFLIFPKILGLILDTITIPIINLWIYSRTNRLEQAKAKMSRGSSSDTRRGYQGKVLRKILGKAGLTFLLEAIPIVGIFPFLTCRVLSTLKEK
ncbi:MAG: hypothetical protein HYV77_02080 [Candidatus Wildermuthbacteria bacterium]|nr:hypothetical protein [Candidatus Wildermuthbacteria bacterium]